MQEHKKPNRGLVWLKVGMCLMFFAAIVLIAAGLWIWSRIAALIFSGVVLLYLSYCFSEVINSA